MIFNIVLAYIAISIIGYFLMDFAYFVTIYYLPVPRRWLYYLLQFTWGLPLNAVGAFAAMVLLCFGKKPKKYGWNYCFELNVNFGLDLGVVFIAPINGSTLLKNHEHGHAIQNIYFGPFTITMVCLPSVLRFWIREIETKVGQPPLTTYDSVWFEGLATTSGIKLIEQIEKGEV